MATIGGATKTSIMPVASIPFAASAANRLKRKEPGFERARQDVERPADSLQFFGPAGNIKTPCNSVLLGGKRIARSAILWACDFVNELVAEGGSFR